MSTFQDTSYTIPISIDGLQFFHSTENVELESGAVLEGVTIAFHTYGKLNAAKDNVVWVCHALSANSAVEDWWKGCFGVEKMLDPERQFIVCANILGSCYGTINPRSLNPKTSIPYGLDFPLFTIRDIAKIHYILSQHLDIQKIDYCIGGSCGGHQVLEMAYLYPDFIDNIVLLVCGAKETPWAIGAHEAQRMALESDATWTNNEDKAASNSLQAARAMALLLYRTFESYVEKQEDTDGRLNDYSAASYMRYQGMKLERRFYAHSYWYLLKALDTHDIGRGRGGVAKALSAIQQPALVISMDSDLLIPPSEQALLAQYLPNATHNIVKSSFGHDGFLLETDKINRIFAEWH